MAETISIIGCGWLGLPLAEKLLQTGYRVKGSATASEKVVLLQQKGITAYQLQLSPEPKGGLEALLQADIVVIAIPPKAAKQGQDFHPDQIRHLANALRQSTIQHVIYISSTSVYPEQNQIAVEDNVLLPDQSASPALVQAEQYIRGLEPEKVATIVRFGGLMGYDRIPGKYVAGRTVDSGAVAVNYIHRDDAVGILVSLIRQKLTGVYNAVAPEHPTRESVYRKSCTDFGYVLPIFVKPAEPIPYKIISPEKLLSVLDYQFSYQNPLDFAYNKA